MRIGCCFNLIAREPGTVGAENIEYIAAAGFDYFEVPLAEVTALSDEEFSIFKTRIKTSGVGAECCNNFLPKTMRLTGPNADHETALAYVDRALPRAQALGVNTVVFGSPGAKNLPDSFPYDEGFKQIISFLQKVNPKAKEHGITIAIEPICYLESNIIRTFAEGCKLAEEAACENVRVLVDYFHMEQENEPVSKLLENGRQFLQHVHFARINGRGFPRKIGEDPHYAPFFAALKEIGYDGRISVEAFSKSIEKDAAAAVDFFKRNL